MRDFDGTEIGPDLAPLLCFHYEPMQNLAEAEACRRFGGWIKHRAHNHIARHVQVGQCVRYELAHDQADPGNRALDIA